MNSSRHSCLQKTLRTKDRECCVRRAGSKMPHIMEEAKLAWANLSEYSFYSDTKQIMLLWHTLLDYIVKYWLGIKALPSKAVTLESPTLMTFKYIHLHLCQQSSDCIAWAVKICCHTTSNLPRDEILVCFLHWLLFTLSFIKQKCLILTTSSLSSLASIHRNSCVITKKLLRPKVL